MVSKKQQAALAKAIKEHNEQALVTKFEFVHFAVLADWLEDVDPKFDRVAWAKLITEGVR
jgi:hypothetical protein